jgi:hypothetical protein
MNQYPNDFDTSVFPAGRSLALSRWMSVWTVIALAVVGVLAVLVVLAGRAVRTQPYLISINRATGEWSVFLPNAEKQPAPKPTDVIQQAVVGNYMKMWFRLSNDMAENNIAWCGCEFEKCDPSPVVCKLCCASAPDLYKSFADNVLTNYKLRGAAGETWALDDASIMITPLFETTDAGGAWRASAVLRSSRFGAKQITAYVAVSRDATRFPMSMGFYVSDFSSYMTGDAN